MFISSLVMLFDFVYQTVKSSNRMEYNSHERQSVAMPLTEDLVEVVKLWRLELLHADGQLLATQLSRTAFVFCK